MSTDEEAGGGGKLNPAGSSLDDNESPIARRDLLLPGRDSWYPGLLSGRSYSKDSFPAGLEISAISVASLYDAHDEIRTMDR